MFLESRNIDEFEIEIRVYVKKLVETSKNLIILKLVIT